MLWFNFILGLHFLFCFGVWYYYDIEIEIKGKKVHKCKTESTRKLSNFNFQWTKTLYQNNLKHIAFFLHFSRAKDVISHL